MTISLLETQVLIIGGGPAGISAAIWCADQGIDSVLIEKEVHLGGQLLVTFNQITNYPGFRSISGKDLADRFLEQLRSNEVTLLNPVTVLGVDLAGGRVTLSDGRDIVAASIVIATGVRRRRLGIPGEDELARRGVMTSGAKERDSIAGRSVVVIGGGDAALENALILSEVASMVTVVHRREKFSARPEFLTRARTVSNIRFLTSRRVNRIAGMHRVEAVELDGPGGQTETVDAEAVLIRIGVDPNTELFARSLALDDRGFIKVDAECRTSRAGVFAIGDVACPASPTISTAVGMAAIAVKAMMPRQ